jgi:hypothetical protein
MDIPVGTCILGFVLVVAVIFVFSGCKLWCGQKKDHFTRTCLSDSTNARFVRSPVDYAMDVDEKGWQRYPHYMADPKDRRQPLSYGPIDFYTDERKLDSGQMWQQYSNTWGGCGNDVPYIVNDTKTRSLLRQVGDETLHRQLNNMGGPMYGPYGASKDTELGRIQPDPFVETHYRYMGKALFNKPVGS